MLLSTKTKFTTLGLIGLISLTLAANFAVADDGDPVAIRHWGDQGFTIETMWGFQIGLGLKDASPDKLSRKPDLYLADIGVGLSLIHI